MIKISSNDKFTDIVFKNLFHQKNLQNLAVKDQIYFYTLDILKTDTSIEFFINQKRKIQYKIPVNFSLIFLKIMEELSSNFIDILNMNYYPLKNYIYYNSHYSQLSEIQNLILLHLSLNLKNGIYKEELSQIIWPKDKDISINKLDTHLTNLKNQIAKDLNFNLKFSSKSSLLKLVID